MHWHRRRWSRILQNQASPVVDYVELSRVRLPTSDSSLPKNVVMGKVEHERHPMVCQKLLRLNDDRPLKAKAQSIDFGLCQKQNIVESPEARDGLAYLQRLVGAYSRGSVATGAGSFESVGRQTGFVILVSVILAGEGRNMVVGYRCRNPKCRFYDIKLTRFKVRFEGGKAICPSCSEPMAGVTRVSGTRRNRR